MKLGALAAVIAAVVILLAIFFIINQVKYTDAQQVEGVWTEVFPSPNPGERRSSAWAYDSINNVIVLFGGMPGTSETWLYYPVNKTWEQQFPVVLPPSRSLHTMTFDSKNGLAVLFGGYRTSHANELNDTWVYEVITNTWRELNPQINPPSRHWPGLVYDKNNEVVVLFGGHDSTPLNGPQEMINDTWLLDVANEIWIQQFPTQSPSPRQTPLIYNEQDGLIYAFGGKYEVHLSTSLDIVYLNDLWKYDVLTNTWSVVHDNSISNDIPEPRRTKWTYDIANNVAVLFGGDAEGEIFGDTWIYNFDEDAWMDISSLSSPADRRSNLIIYDPINNNTLLYGGNFLIEIFDDFWELELDLDTFNQQPIADTGPDQSVIEGTVVTLDGTGS